MVRRFLIIPFRTVIRKEIKAAGLKPPPFAGSSFFFVISIRLRIKLFLV
jgi:hypothetical protein